MDKNGAATNLESLLVGYFAEESMIDDGTQDNRYFCTNCNSKQNAKKKLNMETLPQVLVISLKRFWWEFGVITAGQGKRHKIYHPVDAPFMLDTVKLNIGNAYYMLMGVAVHAGDAYHGHYFSMTRSLADAITAYATKNYSFGTWIKQSDTYINDNLSTTDIKNFIRGRQTTTPYQYYYKRVEVTSGPSSVNPTINDQEPTIDINMNDECEITFDPNDWNVEDEKEEMEADTFGDQGGEDDENEEMETDTFGDQGMENGNTFEIGVCNETSVDELVQNVNSMDCEPLNLRLHY